MLSNNHEKNLHNHNQCHCTYFLGNKKVNKKPLPIQVPYPLKCNPEVLFFITGFWMGFNSNFELLLIEYRVPGEQRLIFNIDRSNTNLQNSNVKGFACFMAKGKNLNFGLGSMQKWGCIQVDTVLHLKDLGFLIISTIKHF